MRPAPTPTARGARHPLTTLSGVLVLALALGGCAADAPAGSGSGSGSSSGAPTGGSAPREVDGAEIRLVWTDGEGAARSLDPESGEVEDLDPLGDADRLVSDGRYLVAVSDPADPADPAGTGVVRLRDGGAWTEPHGDHTHSFTAPVRELGEIRGAGAPLVGTSASGIAVLFPGSGAGTAEGDGELLLLRDDGLAAAPAPDGSGELDAELRAASAIPVELPLGGAVLPLGELVVAGVRDAAGAVDAVTVLDADGAPVVDPAPCPGLTAAVAVPSGALVTCADRALVIGSAGDGAVITPLPLPAGAAPASVPAGRTARPAFAALSAASDRGILLLDSRTGIWSAVEAETALRRVTAVGDDAGRLVAVDAEGRLRVLDGATGATLAATEPLLAEALSTVGADGIPLLVEADRAWAADPASGTVHGIDLDDGSLLLSVPAGIAPRQLVRTG